MGVVAPGGRVWWMGAPQKPRHHGTGRQKVPPCRQLHVLSDLRWLVVPERMRYHRPVGRSVQPWQQWPCGGWPSPEGCGITGVKEEESRCSCACKG